MQTQNLIDQFLAKFEPQGDGLVYHHDGSSGGLPCTAQERDLLLVDILRIHQRVKRWMTAWVLVSALAMAALSITGVLGLESWQQALVFLAPFPFAVQAWVQAHRLPWRRFGRRTPVTPPRAAVDSFWSRVAALPMSLALAMLAVAGLLAWQVLADGWQAASDSVYVLPMLVPPLFSILILHAKSRRRRR